jgi:hypothetical protein
MPRPSFVLFSTLIVRSPPTVSTKTCALVFATHRSPLEVVLLREDVVLLAARVDELDRAALVDAPAEDPLVGESLARLEDGEHPSVRGAEHQELGLAVVAVQILEVAEEGRVR